MFLSFNISSTIAKISWIIVLKWSKIKATRVVLLILFFRYTEFLFFPYSFSGPQVSFREVSNTKLDDLLLYTGTSALIIYISNIQRAQKYSVVISTARCYSSRNSLRGIQSPTPLRHFGGGATSSFDGFINTLEPLWKSTLNHTQLSGTSATESYANSHRFETYGANMIISGVHVFIEKQINAWVTQWLHCNPWFVCAQPLKSGRNARAN